MAKSQDWTVGVALDAAGRVCRFTRFQRPWGDTREAIVKESLKVPSLIDSTGVGDPIVEDLQRGVGHFTGFKFTSQSKQQLMEGLALAINKGEVSFPDGLIRQELEDFEYVHSRTGVKYSAPEGLHDDCVIALALAVSHWRMARGLMALPAGMKIGAL